jgi:hypothetical protein
VSQNRNDSGLRRIFVMPKQPLSPVRRANVGKQPYRIACDAPGTKSDATHRTHETAPTRSESAPDQRSNGGAMESGRKSGP